MYAVDGRSDLTEEELPHLDGYAGSRPVRVGNAAHGQLQLDIYGELMDAAYLHNKYAAPVGYDSWRHLRDLIDWVAGNWGREDEGVWEGRGGRRHCVYSRLMGWGGWRGRSRCAASGGSRRCPGPGGPTRPAWPRPACCSSRCWATATTSGCTPSRPGRAARPWATSRRPSRTWR